MIEIDEIMPFYICNKAKDCNISITCGDCEHIPNPMFAKNADAVKIFEAFRDTFGCIVDNNGRLCVYEKEK